MMRAILCAPIAAAVVLAAAPGSLAAQAPRDSVDSARVKLETVTVTEARATALVGGASAIVVNVEALKSSPAPSLEQALRESPFIHVRQNSRGEMELSVRGSDSRQAAVLVDGVPLTIGWDHRTDPSLVPVTGAQSMVIVRGLGSLLNGPNTLGGSIEITHQTRRENDAWLGAGVDENGAVVTTVGGERLLTGSVSLRGGAAYRKRDGYSLPSGVTDPTAENGLRTNSDLREVDGFASLHWRGTMGKALSANVMGFDAERGVPPEEHVTTPRFWRYPYHSRAVMTLSGSTGAFTTPFGIATVDLGGGYNTGRSRIDIFSDRTYATVSSNEIGDERTLTGRARLTHSLGPGTLRAAVTTADVDYRETLAGVVSDYRQKLVSAGTEIEMPIGLRTTFAGGIVFDQSRTPEAGGRPLQEPFDDIGWRAGISHEVTSGLRLHASGSQRSRFPALRELYSGAANRFQPNPDLKPETLLGFEGGFTWRGALGRNGIGVAEITGFSHNLDDAVVRITVPNPTPPPGTLFRRINQDNIISSGAELLAGYSFGAENRRLSITGDALVQSIQVRNQTVAGNPARHAENNPESRGSLELGIPIPFQLRGIANARYTGKQYCIHGDTGNEVTLRGRTEMDLAVERTFAIRPGVAGGPFRSLRVLASADNIGNVAVFDQCGLPQPGRTMRLMFTLR